MSDLISRKSVLDKLKDFSNMYTLEEEARIVLDTIVRIVTEQPTAYDVEDILVALKIMRNDTNQGCLKVDMKKCNQYSDCGLCIMDRAIDIAKRGGVE